MLSSCLIHPSGQQDRDPQDRDQTKCLTALYCEYRIFFFGLSVTVTHTGELGTNTSVTKPSKFNRFKCVNYHFKY